MSRTSYSRSDGERPSTAVVNALAAHEDTDVGEIRPQLYDVVDPDALDALFGPRLDGRPRTSGRVVFTYLGHRVTVHSDGHVYVGEADETVESGVAPVDE
ncbi:hypothetical protein DMJ13_03155 [halophilic archaeon]|nr:hypothetical protein DMJ13_03155 [halophilic archaeon]